MMSLSDTLLTLQSDNLITGYRLLSEHKAELTLPNGRAIIVHHLDGDKVWTGTIRAVVRDAPRPDFITYDRFEQVEDSALLQAGKMEVKLVTFGRFTALLEKMV